MRTEIPHSMTGHVTTVFSKGRDGERLGFCFKPLKPPTEPIPSLMEIDTELSEQQRARLFALATTACAQSLLAEVTTSTGTATTIDEIEIWSHS